MKKLIIGLIMLSAPAMAQDRVAQYDFDKDGKVSFEDVNRYCTVSSALFERADKNQDGFLSNSATLVELLLLSIQSQKFLLAK